MAQSASPHSALPAGGSPAWERQLLSGRDRPGTWPEPARIRPGWQPAVVAGIVPETPDTVTLRLTLPHCHPFLPGQHFNLEVPAGGTYPAVEAYSAASSPWPDPQHVELTIKEVPGGRVSPLLVRRIPAGTVLAIEGPLGYFTWSEADGGPLALVGAGSGIVPLMAMIRYAAARGLGIPIRLLYSARNPGHAIFGNELGRLASQHRWLQVVHTFTGGPASPAGRYHRRIDRDMLADTFSDIAGSCLAYVCGPFAMVLHVEEELYQVGVRPGRLISENWE